MITNCGSIAEHLDGHVSLLCCRRIFLELYERAGLVEAFVAPEKVKKLFHKVSLVSVLFRKRCNNVDHALNKSVEDLILATLEKQSLEEECELTEELPLLLRFICRQDDLNEADTNTINDLSGELFRISALVFKLFAAQKLIYGVRVRCISF